MGLKQPLNIFWFRRDLRLHDNAGLFYALKGDLPVLPLFIFDRTILDQLSPNDARLTFIHNTLLKLNDELRQQQSALYIKHDFVLKAWEELTEEFEIKSVFTNHDYEPYARQRDEQIWKLLSKKGISFYSYKDQVIFEKDEVVKDNGQPYTVYSPYKKRWIEKLSPFYLQSYPTEKYFKNFYVYNELPLPTLENIGFKKSNIHFPNSEYQSVIDNYSKTRDFPAIDGTSRISVHLRFGTVSIRELTRAASNAQDKTWLQELIWREFYMMILWHFPQTTHAAFKPEYDKIQWRSNEDEFKAWCEGKTGYPIVDAGMRQLNQTGWMHNRVRMIVASFLTKHLLIDWHWGEAYFARKLIDYEQASNVGGWQWAAGTGNDAAPYFRVFNPELQTKKFDPELKYIKKWVPEFNDPFKYPKPIVGHAFARERALRIFKEALSK